MSKIKNAFNYILKVREKSQNFNRSGLYIAFALISFYAAIMSVVCFVKSDTIMGFVNAAIAVFMVLIIIAFAKIKSAKLLSYSVDIFLYVLMLFFLYEGGVGGVSIMWLLFIPMGAMALINLFYGGLLSLLLGITVSIYMITPLHNYGYQYSSEIRIRFPIIYWAFFILALVIFVRIDRVEEQQKELVKRAEISNHAKSEFLANMSHEIRTPMNAIMGMCELTMNEDISEIVRENNDNIYHSGKNLMNIINDLLDFSKIESGKMELSCSQYKLSDVLNDVIYMANARKGAKPLEFTVDLDPDIPELLYGDEMRIKQIMINLLTNAIKYTQEGGFLLSVSYRRETYGINLIISVKDSGIGIKKEHIGKIFDAYGRVDAEKTHTIEGTGLGLPITKKLIRLMNGVISVNSEYGKGTEFRVVIPQKVIEDTPIVTLENQEKINILYYYSMEKMPEFAVQSFIKAFRTVIKKLNTSRYICKNLEDLKHEVITGKYTHVIIGRPEYLEDREYFESLSNEYNVAVIQERADHVIVGENILNIYKPFYTRKFSDIINNQSRKAEKSSLPDEFTAPGASVLIVDDNMLNLKVAQGLMKSYEMNIDTALSGVQALSMMKEKRYDLVFMDHLMPDMDGIETHREILKLESEHTEKTPVIALTANAVSDARDLFITEGFQDFVSKPIQSEVLRATLLKWLPKTLIINKKEQNA